MARIVRNRSALRLWAKQFRGGEAVFEGVVEHSGASRGCFRAVALGCIAVIGVLLSFADHTTFPSYPNYTGGAVGNNSVS